MIGAERLPNSENSEKGENLASVGTKQGFSPFLTYSEPGFIEIHRRPGRRTALHTDWQKLHEWQALSARLPPVSGMPLAWRAGVAMLAERTAPPGVTMARWRVFRWNAERLLADHGAALHDAGWDGLDLFGLYAMAPVTNPS